MTSPPLVGERLYHSDRVYQFQADGVARAYLRSDNLAIWSTGLGKSHLAMALSALLFEDDLIDHVVLACESNKLTEWLSDFSHFTGLDAALYHGALDKRRRIAADPPRVLISTYETLRNDMATKRPRSPRALDDGFLTGALAGSRVLVVYDEVTKLKNRTSATYRHHDHALGRWRKAGSVRTLGLTATPIERSPENVFNIGRLISPGFCTVERFERDHVLGRDEYDNPVGYINISDDRCEPGVTSLYGKLRHCLLVKDKFDADVRAEFPRQVEEFDFVPVEGALRDFYETVLRLSADWSPAQAQVVARQILLHPLSITSSQGALAQYVVGQVGVDGLRALPTPRLDRLLSHLEPLVKGEGRQVVVFSFFGQSVLPLLRDALTDHGYQVAYNTGGMTREAKSEAMAAFRAGGADIFLSSDAGSRGINLPEATCVINYELPFLASTYQQRIDRVHRIDSDAEMVLARSMIAAGTIEEVIAETVLERNAWFDQFIQAAINSGIHNPHRPSAAERRLLMHKTKGDEEE